MSEQQTPLQRWSTMVEIARNWPLSDERQPPLERALVEIAAYAERLENHKAALIETVIEYRAQLAAHTRWPQGDEAAKQLAEANVRFIERFHTAAHATVIRLREISREYAHNPTEIHSRSDGALCGLLLQLGATDVVDAYERVALQRLAKGGSHADAD